MIKKQLTALVNLAKSDDNIDERERSLIFKIGSAHGLSDESIQEIVDHPGELTGVANLDPDEKFEFLYSIIQLMKVDDEIFNEEVEYCNMIADKLGYSYGAVMEMYPVVHKNLVIKSEKLSLKKKLNAFLK
ncbi:TerB family tellurite resistance protein [Reichenbachiella agariperforans]|uniref:TerB family tellurite resistance protein n=1 Tax=Reichenbachiella agariperforans TaxID=156994 RepID=UPI001C09DDF5|nr:TerB family tellurite resistance protein [Reichenbachiella agariperforans]MBU2915444.1 tellurite resistance TerB family protein [Reichenbachiella agariperforans]